MLLSFIEIQEAIKGWDSDNSVTLFRFPHIFRTSNNLGQITSQILHNVTYFSIDCIDQFNNPDHNGFSLKDSLHDLCRHITDTKDI